MISVIRYPESTKKRSTAAQPNGNGKSDPALHTALKAWRSEIARKRGVPAYVVLHDATIDGIVRAWPTTLDELRDVPGIGDKKLEHYGEELLRLMLPLHVWSEKWAKAAR